ncbi:MAG: PKD domain-containing protein, partial [Chitinophagaceae bacterium]
MRKIYLSLSIGLLYCSALFSQDFSNKGKEFWIPYSYHVSMNGGGGGVTMTLYITSDLTTTYQVEIYGGTVLQTGTINAGQVVTCVVPNTNFISDEGLFTGKTVRVTAVKPVVVYSYITQSAISGATVCLPTIVLGKEYYSMNYTQVSNATNANSYFTIIAVEDNTAVEITPTGNTKNGWFAGNTYTVNLNKGQIYQVLGTHNNTPVGGLYTGADLTGSKIKSVSSGTNSCKRIAVFSGAGKMRIGANCGNATTSDNLYQQLYPAASWGKKYLTVPSYNRPTNFYRILKSDPTTNVYLNGVLIPPGSFFSALYYEFSGVDPSMIEADKPISVTQYFTTQGCSGNASPYDPEMIVLNPVEQNINKVTLVSSNLVAPQNQQHHLHIIMRNGGTGISSFKLDGVAVPTTAWVTHPADPNYSYLYRANVTQGYHTLTSDSGFNALAYGYANAESYGYSAGSNVKDLYQFITIQNPYSTVNFPGVCKGTPFYFSIVFPYQPLQIQWVFGTALNAQGIADVTIANPLYDSTWFVNGKQLFRYKLTTPYTINTAGSYTIQVNAQNPTPDGCGGTQEIAYDLQVFDPPTAGFYFTTNGCANVPVQFFDTTNSGGRPIITWQWSFGDATTSGLQNPTHQYTAAGSYNASLTVITDVGCISNPTTKVVNLAAQPVANFGNSLPTCIGSVITFSDSSIISSGAITKWTWNFGDGSPPVIATTNTPQTHIYTTTGPFTVTLLVEATGGCLSTVFSKPITIHPRPLANFALPDVCLPSGAASFTSTSTVATGTIANYLWDFGNSQTGTTQTASTTYSSTGPFNVTLTVTSNNGCVDDTIRILNTVYSQPDANFTVDSIESCFGGTFNFTDQSTAANSSVTQWYWDFGDGTTSTLQNPTKQYSTTGTYLVKLYITSAIGCISDTATMNVVVLQLPTVSYTTSSPVCETQPVQFTSTSVANAGNITQYTWSINSTAT